MLGANNDVGESHFDMRRTFQNNGKGATEVKVLEDVDNARYVRHLVTKMMKMSNINKNIQSFQIQNY